MITIRTLGSIALLASLAACSNTTTPPATPASSASTPPPTQPTTALGRMADKGIREARLKLETENIGLNDNIRINTDKHHQGVSVSSDDDNTHDSRPKAEITPKGDLLIDGKAVAIDANQRALLLDYRAHIISIAESGMDIGVQGADLAAKAMGEAFKGIFSGKSEKDIEKSVEAEAGNIKQAAAKLCDRLPDMVVSQQKLAAAVPEFKPYATMKQEDIENCFKDSQDANVKQAQVQSGIRDNIRSAIRDSVRGGVQAAAKDDAAKTDADAGNKR